MPGNWSYEILKGIGLVNPTAQSGAGRGAGKDFDVLGSVLGSIGAPSELGARMPRAKWSLYYQEGSGHG